MNFPQVLPPELTLKIFSYLDADSLSTCRAVDRNWRFSFAEDPLTWFHLFQRDFAHLLKSVIVFGGFSLFDDSAEHQSNNNWRSVYLFACLRTASLECVPEISEFAARCGDFNFLLWLSEHDYPISEHIGRCGLVGGHLRIFEASLNEFGFEIEASDDLIKYAARGGSIECLERVLQLNANYSHPNVCSFAAESGNIDILRHLRGKDPAAPWNSTTLDIACRFGFDDIFDFCIDSGCPFSFKDSVMNAARYGHFNCMVKCIEHKTEEDTLSADILRSAASCVEAERGNACIRFLFENGCEIDEWCVTHATYLGEYERVNLLISCGAPVSTWAIHHSLACGNEKLFRFLVSKMDRIIFEQLKEDKSICFGAVRNGHIHLLDVMQEMGFDLNIDLNTLNAFFPIDQPTDIVQWFETHYPRR